MGDDESYVFRELLLYILVVITINYKQLTTVVEPVMLTVKYNNYINHKYDKKQTRVYF